jgi:hypothetical protein
MSDKKILHSTNFDDGKRNGWGEIGHEQLSDLVREGTGLCLATKENLEPRMTLECFQRTLKSYIGKKVLLSFDLRVVDPPEGFSAVWVNTGKNNNFSVKSPAPSVDWHRYSIAVDLTKPTAGSFDIGPSYSHELKPTTRAFFDNILIESDD